MTESEFCTKRNELLAKHREAVQTFASSCVEIAVIERVIENLREQVVKAEGDLGRATDRSVLRNSDVEQAMGNLIDHERKHATIERPLGCEKCHWTGEDQEVGSSACSHCGGRGLPGMAAAAKSLASGPFERPVAPPSPEADQPF